MASSAYKLARATASLRFPADAVMVTAPDYDESAGAPIVMPQNTWHRFHAPEGVSLMTATPKPTEHLTVDHLPPMLVEPLVRGAPGVFGDRFGQA